MLSLLTQLQTASKGITKAVGQYNTAGRKEAWKRATEWARLAAATRPGEIALRYKLWLETEMRRLQGGIR